MSNQLLTFKLPGLGWFGHIGLQDPCGVPFPARRELGAAHLPTDDLMDVYASGQDFFPSHVQASDFQGDERLGQALDTPGALPAALRKHESVDGVLSRQTLAFAMEPPRRFGGPLCLFGLPNFNSARGFAPGAR